MDRWVYMDENGNVLYRKTRVINEKGKREYIVDPKGTRKVLYNLPGIIRARRDNKPIFLCEGEKDADCFIRRQLCGTTSPSGTGGWLEDWVEWFRGMRVFIMADNDDAGMQYAAYCFDRLRGIAASASIYKSRVAVVKADVWDHFHAGYPIKGALGFVRVPRSGIPRLRGGRSVYGNGVVEDVDLFDARVLADIKEEPVRWLWYPYIPANKITIIDGDPGLGKSTVWADVMARASSGRQMPTGQPVDASLQCIVMSGEDEVADTIIPRLRAAGANLKNVWEVRLRRGDDGTTVPFTIPEDMAPLKAAVRKTGARLICIDPVTSFFGERIMTNNDASVRKAMGPLAEMCSEFACAVICVRHLKKDTSETNALYRGGGSIAFSGAARSVLLLAPDPEGERGDLVLAQTKQNLTSSASRQSLKLRIDSWVEDAYIPVVGWNGLSGHSANDLLSKRKPSSELIQAKELMLKLFAEKPVWEAKEIQDYFKNKDVSRNVMFKAKELLGVESRPVYNGGKIVYWEWEMKQ